MLEPIDPETVNLWEPLIGTSPEAVHRRPRDPSAKEEGPFLDGWLSVEANNTRIDWRFGHDPTNPPAELPIVGAYGTLHTEFRDLMKRWLVESPPIQRIGYGAVLLLSVNGVAEGNRRLSELLPLDIDQDTTDFLYRINRRRHAKCLEGIEINRLSTWSVASVVGLRVDMLPLERRMPALTRITDRSACRLELDINTAPEFRSQIPKDTTPHLFDELVTLGNEIASSGDIP